MVVVVLIVLCWIVKKGGYKIIVTGLLTVLIFLKREEIHDLKHHRKNIRKIMIVDF